jgi:hypothetical protein
MLMAIFMIVNGLLNGLLMVLSMLWYGHCLLYVY